MKKVYVFFILLLITTFLWSCNESAPDSEDMPETHAPSIIYGIDAGGVGEPVIEIEPFRAVSKLWTGDNSIDRAFARIVNERREELEGNTVLAYIYALKWKEEYESLSSELMMRIIPDELPEEPWERYYTSYKTHYPTENAAIEYAKLWSDSRKAIDQFEGIARYYKLMAYDCIARLSEYMVDTGIQANEEELYEFLNDFQAYYPIPYEDYRSEYQIPYETIFPMLIVAALPDSDIYITSAPPFGAVLTVRGEEYFYTWDSGVPSPREILPKLSLFDYDGDGINELAVILCTGYGTGCYIEDLVIVEINENMAITTINSETIRELLYHRISASYNPNTNEVKIALDDDVLSVDIPTGDEEWIGDFKSLDLESIISFSIDNEVLAVHISIGLCGFSRATPFDYIEFYADIGYYGGKNYRWPDISLSNCRIEHLI